MTALANLWGALLIPATMGIMCMLSLCILAEPYSVGIVGWYSNNLDTDLFSSFNRFFIVFLNLCVSVYSLFIGLE